MAHMVNQYMVIHGVDYKKRIDLPCVIYCVLLNGMRRKARMTENNIEQEEIAKLLKQD